MYCDIHSSIPYLFQRIIESKEDPNITEEGKTEYICEGGREGKLLNSAIFHLALRNTLHGRENPAINSHQ